MRRTHAWKALAAGLPLLVGAVGCVHCEGSLEDRYRNWVDGAWPYRYNYSARQAVLAPFAQQTVNGQFLHQTLWNWHFEPGSDQLNGAGVEKLNTLVRNLPHMEPRIYLQTARDIAPTAENLARLKELRAELDARRAAAIRRYVAAQPGGSADIEVFVHDAPPPGMPSRFGVRAFADSENGYQGGIAGFGGVGVGGARGGGGGPAVGGTPAAGGAGTTALPR